MSVKMAEATKACLFWYGFSEGCDLLVKQYAFVDGGTKLTLQYNGERVSFLFPLMGRFNIYNCLAAMSAALTYGHSLVDVARAASQFSSVPGRLQAISNNLGLQIFVDFAHSEDALKNILKTLQETAKARIITLFGCGGDRDRKKRPLMARAAEHYSTFCVVTSDNPRSENPASIAEEIRKGFLHPERHKVELDREKAIELALTLGEPGDTVVLAGKGHEPYQIFATHTRPFSDATVAKELCQKLEGTRCR